jgi:hypothetical protein
LDERRRLGHGVWSSLPEREHVTSDERAEAAAMFGPDGLGLWTGHSSLSVLIDELAAAETDPHTASKVEGLKVVADYAASLLLGTGLANQSQRTSIRMRGKTALAINFGPAAEHCADALHTAGAGFLPCLGAVIEKYASELSDELRRCEAFAWRAWKDPALLATLSDDDACPCDRPGTLWGDCHKWTDDLGTTAYVPLTDADIVNFVPWDPAKHQPAKLDRKSDPMPNVPDGPLILTYTFRLPFALGAQAGMHFFGLKETWADPDVNIHLVMRMDEVGDSGWPAACL